MVNTAHPPSPCASPIGEVPYNPLEEPVAPEEPLTSVEEGKWLKEDVTRSYPKKCTKNLAKKKKNVDEGGSRFYIEFPGNASTRKISARMISTADGFFFPQDKEWLQSLSFCKFYEMSISSFYRAHPVLSLGHVLFAFLG